MPGNMFVEARETNRKLYIESWHKDGWLHGNLVAYWPGAGHTGRARISGGLPHIPAADGVMASGGGSRNRGEEETSDDEALETSWSIVFCCARSFVRRLCGRGFGRVNIVSFSPAAGLPNFPKPDKKKLLENIEVVRFLVRNGADVNNKTRYYKETALHQAVEDGKTAMADILIRDGRADANAKNRHKITPLHVVRDVKLAKLLVSVGADVHAKTEWGNTPLHDARGAEITRLHIEAGADVNVINKDGATPLHMEIYGNPSVITLLLKAGADVNARDAGGYTPLEKAARYSREETFVKALRDAGASPAVRDEKGKTP